VERTLTEDPKCAKDKTESELPILDTDLREMLEPKLAASSTESELPKSIDPNSETAEPNRANVRRDMAEPRLTN
jgi:hypothetical protein